MKKETGKREGNERRHVHSFAHSPILAVTIVTQQINSQLLETERSRAERKGRCWHLFAFSPPTGNTNIMLGRR